MSEPKRRDAGGKADAHQRQILLRHLRAHFHFAAAGKAEQPAGAGADDLADLDRARQDQPGGGSADVESPDSRAAAAQIGLGHPDARVGGIARGAPAVDIGLGHEAARDQRLGAVEFILGERRVGPRDGDLRRQLRGFLALHRAVDRREHLALADPASGIDIDPGDEAAFAGDADRLVAPRGKRAAGGDRARDLAAPGDDDRDGRDLAAGPAGARRAARASPPAAHHHRREGQSPGRR